MNKELLFDAMNYVDDGLLEQSEQEKSRSRALWGWGSLAACFALALIAAVFVFGRTPDTAAPQLQNPSWDIQPTQTPTSGTAPQTQAESPYGDRLWTASYNQYTERTEMDVSRVLNAGYFYEDVSAQQLQWVLPVKQEGWQVKSARAGFLRDGKTDCVAMEISAGAETVYVTVGNYFSCVLYPEDTKVRSKCGDLEYTLYRFDLEPCTYLEADTTVNGMAIHFTMQTDDPEQGAGAFEQVLECFSWYGDGCPNPEQIRPSRIPEYVNQQLDMTGAREDPDLGKWFLQKAPDGFQKESICRYKDYYSDCLYGSWTHGYDQLRWEVSKLTPEDEKRITEVSQKENYDLSLYPIPRADSVPEELREIVDDPIFRFEELTQEVLMSRYYEVYDGGEGGNSGRMRFSVLYGDVLVSVSTKGVSPQWLYDRLTELPGQ